MYHLLINGSVSCDANLSRKVECDFPDLEQAQKTAEQLRREGHQVTIKSGSCPFDPSDWGEALNLIQDLHHLQGLRDQEVDEALGPDPKKLN